VNREQYHCPLVQWNHVEFKLDPWPRRRAKLIQQLEEQPILWEWSAVRTAKLEPDSVMPLILLRRAIRD
jgi:hypothetical protein